MKRIHYVQKKQQESEPLVSIDTITTFSRRFRSAVMLFFVSMQSISAQGVHPALVSNMNLPETNEAKVNVQRLQKLLLDACNHVSIKDQDAFISCYQERENLNNMLIDVISEGRESISQDSLHFFRNNAAQYAYLGYNYFSKDTYPITRQCGLLPENSQNVNLQESIQNLVQQLESQIDVSECAEGMRFLLANVLADQEQGIGDSISYQAFMRHLRATELALSFQRQVIQILQSSQ